MFSPLDELYIADFIRNIRWHHQERFLIYLDYKPVGTGSTDK
jgi:hypothetical protein